MVIVILILALIVSTFIDMSGKSCDVLITPYVYTGLFSSVILVRISFLSFKTKRAM